MTDGTVSIVWKAPVKLRLVLSSTPMSSILRPMVADKVVSFSNSVRVEESTQPDKKLIFSIIDTSQFLSSNTNWEEQEQGSHFMMTNI